MWRCGGASRISAGSAPARRQSSTKLRGRRCGAGDPGPLSADDDARQLRNGRPSIAEGVTARRFAVSSLGVFQMVAFATFGAIGNLPPLHIHDTLQRRRSDWPDQQATLSSRWCRGDAIPLAPAPTRQANEFWPLNKTLVAPTFRVRIESVQFEYCALSAKRQLLIFAPFGLCCVKRLSTASPREHVQPAPRDASQAGGQQPRHEGVHAGKERLGEIAMRENNRGTSLSGEVVMDCRRNLRACRALLAAWLAVPAVVQVAGGVS